MRTRNWHHVLALGIIVIAPISITRGAQTYQLTDLGALPGTNSYALGINNQGQVVGYFQTFGGTHAFLYSSGTTTDLGLLGGGSAYALSINDPGQIVGFAEVTNSAHAFLFSNGAMTDLGTLGGSASFAFGINSAGEVVGYIDTANGARAFLYNTSGLYQLGTLGGTNSFAYGINSFTQITGTSSTDNDGRTQAFLWQNGALLNLDSLLPAGSGWELENAHGINDKGEIAGWGTINGQQRGFLYGNGSVTDLDTLPGGTNSFALGLNNGGQIVGVSSTHNGTTHAFLWQNGAMTDLNDLLPKDSGWELREARGINDFGQMVGWGIFNGEERAFLLDSNNETQKQGKAALTAGVQAGPLEATRNFKVSPFSGPSGPVTNTPLADAHVRDGSSASVNFGTSTLMELQTSSTSGNNRDVYFKFDISTAPTPLGSGKLRVFASLSANGSVITTAYSVSDTNWTESGITWNNRPSLGSAQTNQTFNVKAGATYDIDVTSYLRSEQNAGHSTVTLALHCTNNTTPLANINSKENASNKPQLILNTNDFPAVSITSPTNNSSFPAPTNLTISATASDGDGTITKVDFFAGSVLLGTDTTSPYSIVWSNAPVGTYGLTARATDDLGAVSTSAVVNITITTNLIAIADAHVKDSNPSTNFGTNTTLEVQTNGASGPTRDAYLKFNLTGVTNMSSATLRIFASLSGTGSAGTTAYSVTSTNWGETTIVWTNKPPLSNALNSVTVSGTTAAWYAIDVTSFVQSESGAGRTFITLALHCQTNSTRFIQINSREAASNNPALLITTTNSAPVISITTPTNNAVFAAPANISITATASDNDDTISQVEFFQGSTSLGVIINSPYTVTWANASLGTNALTARATDSWGLTSTSAVVNVIVDNPPSVSLTAPANGADFPTYPTNITLTATASDSDGTVSKVEFFQGTNSLGVDTTSPYSITWSNVAYGQYTITAKATDNLGVSTVSASITVLADNVPAVSITSPTNGATFTVPTNITINASASDSDGTVTQVNFYAGGVWLGSAQNSPYTVTWGSAVAGVYGLTAVAFDNFGASSTSAVVYITNRFVPTNFTGLRLWLDAAAGVTTNASGQVSLWTDQSGNSNNASQGTTANQPVWLGNALNSRPVLRFDGTNGQMVLPGYFVSNNFSLFVVARSIAGHEVDVEGNASGYNTGGSGQRYLFGGVVNFNSFGEVGVSIGTNGLSVYEYGRNQIGSDHFAPLAVYEGPVGTNFNLIALTYTNHYPTLQKNGALVRAGLSSSRSDSVFTKTIGLGVNGSGFSGDVAEIMIYNRSLSLDEQAQLIGYLNDKYRLYAIPAAPATVSASALSPAQVMVSWHQNATNTIRSGVLERRLGAGSYVALAALENRSTYLDTNTTAATQYTYRLRARNQAGVEEYSSEASVITPATGPDLPVANLKLWLQAGSQHEIEHAGSWQDLTGSTNFAYQGTSTNRPAVIFGGINGWPVLRFDGTNDQLVLQNYFVSNNFAVFAVARTDQGHEIDAESNAQQNNTGYTGQRYLFGGVINFNDFGEAGLSVGTNGFSAYEYARNGIGSDFFSPLAVYAGSLGTNFNLLTLSYSNQQPSLYLNSALVRTGLVSPRSGSVFTKTMGFGTTGYGNSPFVGDVAEILVFDRQLTVAEQGLVSRYLNDKYACVPPSSAPIQLAARTLSPTQIGLSWRQTQTNALTSYLIERHVGTNGTFNAVAQVGSDWRFIDPGLTPQTLYSYRVRNVLNNSTNAYSNEAQAQTLTAGADFPLASAAIWLRAEDIGLIDGAAVASWPDFWQPTQAAVQTNATDQPTLAATGLNGRAAVRFSGGKYFVLPSVLSNASAAEIFVVLTSITNAPAANQGLWKFNTNGPSYYPAVGGGVQDAFGSTNSRSLLAPLPDLTVASIYNVAADTNLWRARLNGPVKQLLTTNTVSFGGTPWLGRSAQGASEPFAGFVSEVIAFNRVLTLDEQKTVRDSLAQRFGVTTELPHIPSNLTLTRTNSVDYRMSWTALVGSENGLECYFVVERQPDTNTAFLPLQTLNRTNSLYIDNTELPEISYAFRFVVVNDVGVVFSSSLAAALTDTDGDGVPDYLEIILGTNPNSSDTDGDGLPDGWELKYGLNPRSSTGRDGASGDFDNDGITNLQEYQQGTSPADGVVGDNPLIRLRVYRPK